MKHLLLIMTLATLINSCSQKSNVKPEIFIGFWEATKEQKIPTVDIEKVGENFTVSMYEEDITGSFDAEHGKILLSGNNVVGGGMDIIYNPTTKTIIVANKYEFIKKSNIPRKKS